MKVYVATSWANKDEAAAVMGRFRAEGVEVTHDWTRNSDEGLEGKEKAKYLTKCAETDFMAVRDCDLLFLIADDRGRGSQTELGLALAWGKHVVIAKGAAVSNVFFLLTNWRYKSIDAAFAMALLLLAP